MRHQKGFCLTELLVVLTVIGLLSALLIPALIRAKQKVKGISCQANLKQWHAALALYALDNGDSMPPEGKPNPLHDETSSGGYSTLSSYLNLPSYYLQEWRTNQSVALPKSLYLCPGNKRKSNGRNLFHYAINQYLDGTGEFDSPVRLSSLPNPSTLVWIFDSKNLPAVGRWTFTHTNLHSGGANIAFVDGHVSRFSHRQLAKVDPTTGISQVGEMQWIPNPQGGN